MNVNQILQSDQQTTILIYFSREKYKREKKFKKFYLKQKLLTKINLNRINLDMPHNDAKLKSKKNSRRLVNHQQVSEKQPLCEGLI